MTGNTTLSTLTLTANGLNATIKRHTIANWVKKQYPIIYCLQKTHLTEKINTGLDSKDGKSFSKQMDPINRHE
jgi:hypothetical protein